MARQPFLRFYKPGMHYAIGVTAINQRPELASLVAQCIAMWTDIELQVGLALAAILKADNPASVALFLAIRTSPMRRAALSAVARRLLTGDDLKAFEALLLVYQRLEKERNALAHGVFGYSAALPDALLWDSIENHADFLINVYLAEYRGMPLPDPHEKLRKNMFVYLRTDLEELLAQLTELQKAAFYFHARHQPRPMTHDYLKDILSLPLIRDTLHSLKRSADGRSQPPRDFSAL